MSDAQQMLIARVAPTVHVHLPKHGGTASKGHCIAFPQAVQEPATSLSCLPAEVDITCVRRQGKDYTHEDFRVRRHRDESTIILLMLMLLLMALTQSLPQDGELPDLRDVEFSETEGINNQGLAP